MTRDDLTRFIAHDPRGQRNVIRIMKRQQSLNVKFLWFTPDVLSAVKPVSNLFIFVILNIDYSVSVNMFD